MENKKTIVLGASLKPERYSYRAVESLTQHGHDVIAVGLKEGQIGKIEIQKGWPADINDVHTITLYLSAKNQIPYYSSILNSGIERLIFNPGTENPELYMKAKAKGIDSTNTCTLVQLSIGNF